MPQAKISVNAVVGSDDDVPLANVVQLDNVNIGGELTYNWTILDQPPGSADVLSSNVVQSPTFTPRKEGTYFIKLVVNLGLASEQEDRVIVGVRQVKTRERIPAAGETTESDSADGWSTAMNSLLRRIDTLLSDPATMVGKNNSGGVLNKGQVVRVTSLPTIKTGLPGQEVVPGFVLALATVVANVDELLAIVEGGPDGSVSVADQGIVKVRHFGVPRNADGTAQTFSGSPAVGDPVYCSDTGSIALTGGSVRRQVGSVAASPGGAIYSILFNGVGGADITPIDRRYVVHGPGGMLTDAVRVDGANATGITGTPFRIKAGDAATVPFQVQGFAAGLDPQQWLSSGGTVLARITNAGQLTLDAEGISILTAAKHITFANADQQVRWPNFNIKETGGLWAVANVSGTEIWTYFRNADMAQFTIAKGPFSLATGMNQTTGLGFIWTNGPNHLVLGTSATAQWQVTFPTGALAAFGGNRAIQNVLNPVTAQDATTKIYVDKKWDAAGLPNYLINGHFRYWQRFGGATQTIGGSRTYNADRWQFIRDSGSMNYARVSTAPGAKYFVSLSRTIGDVNIGFGRFWQELDRDTVETLGGRRLRLTFRVQVGLGYSATSNFLGVEVYAGTVFTEVLGTSGYTTGSTTVLSTDVVVTPGAAWTTYTVDVGVVPVFTHALAVRFTTKSISNPAVAGDTVEISNVHLYESDDATDTSGGFVQWQPYGGSEQAELDACMKHYEKSYEIETAEGTATSNGAWDTNILTNIGTPGVGGLWPLGIHPRFKVQKWRTPSLVNIWSISGALNQWSLGGADNASSASAVTQIGFRVLSQTVNAPANPALGHWSANAEL